MRANNSTFDKMQKLANASMSQQGSTEGVCRAEVMANNEREKSYVFGGPFQSFQTPFRPAAKNDRSERRK